MRKLWRIVVVMLAAALLMEGALRLLGFVAALAKRAAPQAPVSGGRRILCMGDCMVLGVGGRGFPEQMQDILRVKYHSADFTVINDGKAAGNSSYVSANIAVMLQKYRPGLVIIMTGRNNDWNPLREGGGTGSWFARNVRLCRLYRYMRYGSSFQDEGLPPSALKLKKLEEEEEALLEKFKPHSGSSANEQLVLMYCASAQLYYNLNDFENSGQQLDKAIGLAAGGSPQVLREIVRISLICRFPDRAIRLLDSPAMKGWDRAEQAFFRGKAAVLLGDFTKAKKYFEQAIGMNPHSWEYRYELGRLYEHEAETAIRHYREAARLNPAVPHPHYGLGLLLKKVGKADEAEKEFKLALRAAPADADSLRRLAELYSERGKGAQFSSLREEIPELSGSAEFLKIEQGFKTGGGKIQSDPQADWEADIAAAVQAAKRAGVPVIVSSYPELNLPGMRAAAEGSGAKYVDLMPVFKREFKSRSEYIAYDEAHCNTRGYRAIAELFTGMAEDLFGLRASTSAGPAGKK